MNKKYLILIAVVAVIAAAGAFLLSNNNVSDTATSEHTTLVLSKSSYMEVPKSSNATDHVNKKGIFTYKIRDDDINITSCSNLSMASSAKAMKKLKDNITTGSKKVKQDNAVIFEKNGIYSIFVRNTQYNDTLIIQSGDINLLLQCWQSVKYHDPTKSIKFDNGTNASESVVSAVEKTESVVKANTPVETPEKSTSESSSQSSSSSSSWDYYGGGSTSSGRDYVSDVATTSDDLYPVDDL